jgi:LexA-binding, inner membrane-associated putative hydrolase
MPSPVAHVIAGVTAGWLVAGRPKEPGTFGREALVLGALGALPDLDLLFGAHSGPTHSLGAALVVGILAGCVQLARLRRPGHAGLSPLVLAVACSAAYGSHALLDWLGTDTSPPIGIMALWPFSAAHYESDAHIFMAISRRYYHGWMFVRHNAMALVRELMILVPLLMLTIIVRSRFGSRQTARP